MPEPLKMATMNNIVRSAAVEIPADTKLIVTGKAIPPTMGKGSRMRLQRVKRAAAKGKTAREIQGMDGIYSTTLGNAIRLGIVAVPGRKFTGMRNSAEATHIAMRHWPCCCVICGRRSPLQLAHLDHDPGNNDPDNLAWLCLNHH